MDLNILWFILLGVLLTGYAILDGFDLGVGILHLVARTDEDRRIFMNSIGPLWDGNEVWLVTFGGALFAAFPHAYATIFSGFYLAFMLLLFCLIFRAVSLEFRSKHISKTWRKIWDASFFGASLVATLLFGVTVGDVMQGIPVAANFEYAGSFWDLINPYALLVGVFAVALFMMHGSIYLYLKTEGELQKRLHNWIWKTFGIFLVLYMLLTIVTLVHVPRATENFKHFPLAWIVVVLNVFAIANIPRAVFYNKPGYAFISSCATIAAFTTLFSFALFPDILPSSLTPEGTLTIYNAASSPKTLAIMRNIAFLGMPFVLAYTISIYWVFRGKVKLNEFSY